MHLPKLTRFVQRCPAKLNVRLAVVGQRNDGFHELRSAVAPITLFDRLTIEWEPKRGSPALTVSGDETLASDTATNLVLQAAHAFCAEHPLDGRLHLHLHKEIPVAAGLGGGSSNAAGTLTALQAMCGYPLASADLQRLARGIGADVPFFLHPETAIMRGIGDELTPAPGIGAALQEHQVLVFKPWIGIATTWAYEALAASGQYQDADEEERVLAAVEVAAHPLEELPFNAFRTVIDPRYPTLPVLLDELNAFPGVSAEMTGSGSACFALYRNPDLTAPLCSTIRSAWGESAFLASVRIM